MTGYDVVIVGGRVAGASTALLLARAGVRVALVERSGPGRDTVSTHGLMRAGVLQLRRWGLLDRVVAAGTPPIAGTVFRYRGGPDTRVSIRPRAGVAALYAPRRHLLDQLLVDAAAEAGADVVPGLTVTALCRDNSRVGGVHATGRDGHSVTLPAEITVGADGVRSTVADLVSAPVVRRGHAASGVLYRYVAELPTDGYEWAYGDHAAAGLIPTNHGQTCVFVSTTAGRMRTLRRLGGEQAFGVLLAAAAPSLVDRVGAARPASRLHGWAGTPGYVRRSWGRGWALVGDAGYFKDPITTHGMTDALRDAELLADAVLASYGGRLPQPVALAGYQAARDRMSAELFAATEQVAGYDWDVQRVQGLLRRVSSAMSDEVEYLESLPDRRLGRSLPRSVRADSVANARLA
jgi:2-polyprenyl-6-methoxyphenol hydroxylase-like FAD-dependent oxidoreductase